MAMLTLEDANRITAAAQSKAAETSPSRSRSPCLTRGPWLRAI